MKTLLNSGIYYFYNESAKCFLACSENMLTLSPTPFVWDLKSANATGYYVYAENTDLLLDIDNAYIAEGTTIKAWRYTGYAVQIWNIKFNANGTYSFLCSLDERYCLGFTGGKATLQRRVCGNKMQEWEARKVTKQVYKSFTSKGCIVELQLPLDITTVISEMRLQQWADNLEKAFYSFYELTNYKPYPKIIVEAYKPSKYTGYVLNDLNIIHIDSKFLYEDLRKMAVRQDDWNFCALHEMGHMFDNHRPWNFEAEMMTDLKLAYVLEKNGAAATPAEFNASYNFYGKDIIRAYNWLGSEFSKTYNIFGVTKRFLEIKEKIGWEVYRKTFHKMQEECKKYDRAKRQDKFEKFVDLLSHYSGENIKAYFTVNEWNTIINKVNE